MKQTMIHIRTRLAVLAMLGILAGLSTAFPTAALAQTGNLYFFTVKGGSLDTSSTGDQYFDYITNTEGHGALLNNRKVQTINFEQDIYGISGNGVGLGVGLELLRYNKQFVFQDGERLNTVVKGIHFTIKTYLRLGGYFPFLGAGIGNYYVNMDRSSGLSLRSSPSDVYNLRVGLFHLLGRHWGLLLEAGQTSAQLDVPVAGGTQTLELGGSYTNLGLSYVF